MTTDRTPTLPSTPVTAREFKYRSAAKTDVAITLDAARKRVGALTGTQVRDARRRAEREAQQQQQTSTPATTVVTFASPVALRKARP